MVLFVGLQVLREGVNAFSEKRDLDLRRTCVLIVRAVFRDQFALFLHNVPVSGSRDHPVIPLTDVHPRGTNRTDANDVFETDVSRGV